MRARSNTLSSYARLEGNLFLPDQLRQIFEGKNNRQSDSDYKVSLGHSYKDECAIAYGRAKYEWQAFEKMQDSLHLHHQSRALLENFVSRFFDSLGYRTERLSEDGICLDIRVFPIGFMLKVSDALCFGEKSIESCSVPLVIVDSDCSLDSIVPELSVLYPDTKSVHRKSAFALMQEFLNAHEQYQWGMITNGKKVRLLRDAMSFGLPSYLEFDFGEIFTQDDYAQYMQMWLTLHSSRTFIEGKKHYCAWEEWVQRGISDGQPARDGMRATVREAIVALGTGFVQHEYNEALRQALASNKLSAQEFNHELLRLIYRLIFICCLEERDLLHPKLVSEVGGDTTTSSSSSFSFSYSAADSDSNAAATLIDGLGIPVEPPLSDSQRHHQAIELYRNHYSLHRCMEYCRNRVFYNDFSDAFEGIKVVLRSLERGEERLALPALGGLFDASQTPHLSNVQLSNSAFYTVVRLLRYAKIQGRYSRIDYRHMGTEELGSVYESLLELIPIVHQGERPQAWSFAFIDDLVGASERKNTGSYYTPDFLVQSLIKTALDPIIQKKLSAYQDDPEQGILSLRVIDPSCGSGHFLLAAARRIAEFLAQVRSKGLTITATCYRKALRDVIQRCIYGVDINPLAVELARMSLWLEGFCEGKALSFLDHHLKVGNALLGVFDLSLLLKGIPKVAYKVAAGDTKKVCSALTKVNDQQLNVLAGKLDTTESKKTQNTSKALSSMASILQQCGEGVEPLFKKIDLRFTLNSIEEMRSETLAQEQEKASKYRDFSGDIERSRVYQACNLYLAAFMAPKTSDTQDMIPLSEHLAQVFMDCEDVAGSMAPYCDYAAQLAREYQFFHWPLEFPQILGPEGVGGFDCVLGNPPWEKAKVENKEWFKSVKPAIANAKKADERKKMIEALSKGEFHTQYEGLAFDTVISDIEKGIYASYQKDIHSADCASNYLHLGNNASSDILGPFPLTGVGDTNLYAYFAELALKLRSKAQEGALTRIGGSIGQVLPAGMISDDSTKAYSSKIFREHMVSSIYHFDNEELIFPIAQHYAFVLLTLCDHGKGDCVFYATKMEHLDESLRHIHFDLADFELLNPNTKTCVLVRSYDDLEMLRKLFVRGKALVNESVSPVSNPWSLTFANMFHMSNKSDLFQKSAGMDMVPLYEAKLISHFDHRFASFNKAGKPQPNALEDKQSRDFELKPRYWVDQKEVKEWLNGSRYRAPWTKPWIIGIRDIARPTDQRTLYATVLPSSWAMGGTLNLLMPQVDERLAACLLANINSIILDFAERLKQGGMHANQAFLKQLPVLPPEAYSEEDIEYIVERVAKLTRTSNEISKVWLTSYPQYDYGDELSRLQLRSELDAYFAKLYGLSASDLEYILDPSIKGVDFPSLSFPQLKKAETKLYGEYLTQRLVSSSFSRKDGQKRPPSVRLDIKRLDRKTRHKDGHQS